MSKIIHKEILTITPSSGTGTANTSQFLNGLLREVIASPATDTTTYDFTITSPENTIIYQTTSQTGDMADEVALPVRGVHTVTISNASVDELFNINLVIDE